MTLVDRDIKCFLDLIARATNLQLGAMQQKLASEYEARRKVFLKQGRKG